MKELHKGANYWNTFDTGETEWPQIRDGLSTKVLIIGGGMSGLLTSYMLWQHGIDFLLVEAKQISEGSSLASTGLIQYCSDIMLHELRKAVGKQQADLFYLSCYDAVTQIKDIAKQISPEVGDVQSFSRKSMQYCSFPKDAVKLRNEYEALSSIGLPCELWDRELIQQHFPFSKQLGLVTHEDAEINPHLFVLRLAQYLTKHGARLFERSKVSAVEKLPTGTYRVCIDNHIIEAQYIVHAVGYQFQQLSPQLQCIVNRSYVIVTEPVANLDSVWHDNMMLWESTRPYLYLRTTADSRIIIGGLDEQASVLDTVDDSLLRHSEKLLTELEKLFPQLSLKIAHAWNAFFNETKDGLPYIGIDPKDSSQLYVLGYGGNGTVYSMIGASLIASYINESEPNTDLMALLSLDRKLYRRV